MHMQSLIQILKWNGLRRRRIRHRRHEIGPSTPLLNRDIIPADKWRCVVEADVGHAALAEFAASADLVYFLNRMLLHFCWDTRRY